MRRIPQAVGALGAVTGLVAGFFACGAFGEAFVLGVQPGGSSGTARLVGGVAVAAALVALTAVLLERRAPRASLALLVAAAIVGFAGARGYWTVPCCLLLLAAVLSMTIARGGAAVDRSPEGRRSRVGGTIVGAIGGAVGVAEGLVLLGALGSYFALGPGGGQTYLEVRTIAASVVLTGSIGIAGALVARSRPRLAWPILAFAALSGNVGIPLLWLTPAGILLGVAAILVWSGTRPSQPGRGDA